MLASRIEQVIFALILLGYLTLGSMFAIQTPAWQAPDEPAHYNYIGQVVENGCCPIIEIGDWQQEYQSELTASRFHPDLLERLPTIQYENHQPPLYYLLQSIVYRLATGDLITLRLFSMFLGAGVVVLTYLVGKAIFPNQSYLALAAMALVAFLPQHMAMLSAVNNDTLAEVIIGLTLLLTVRYLKGENVRVWQLGLLVGIGFITKTTTYFLAGVVPIAIFLHWRQSEDGLSVLIKSVMMFLIPALILGGIWWLRDVGVYGFPDFLGLGAHDLVVADQPRAAEKIAELGMSAYLQHGLQTTFQSFWGQFGWMAVPMTGVLGGIVYPILLGLLLAAGSGVILYRFISPHAKASDQSIEQRNIWIVMSLTLLLAMLAYLYYNTEFEQFQGRYMFPGLIPFALLMALGIDSWRHVFLKRWAWSVWMTVIVFLPLAVLGWYMLTRFIVNLVPNI